MITFGSCDVCIFFNSPETRSPNVYSLFKLIVNILHSSTLTNLQSYFQHFNHFWCQTYEIHVFIAVSYYLKSWIILMMNISAILFLTFNPFWYRYQKKFTAIIFFFFFFFFFSVFEIE